MNGKYIGKEQDFPENTGILIESPGFIPYYSGYKNLKLLADLKGKIGKEEILRYMDQMDILHARNKSVKKYSLDMRQRLAIVQAVMEEPELLIMDEPMNALDKEGIVQMQEFFQELKQKGVTILLTSHNFEDIELLCERVFEMDHGKLQEFRV